MIDYTLPLDQLPDPLPIEPLRKPFDVTITPPGSKSITCRAYVLAALAKGESKIIRPLRADDTEHLLNALCTLGAEARWVKGEAHDGEDVLIKGVSGRFPRGGNLYMGDGGAPTRFMIACACLAAEPVVIDASPRMRERPIAEGVDMLRQLGAQIEYVEEEGRLPVAIVSTRTFRGGEMGIGRTDSSQFISAIMLIAPSLEDGIIIQFETQPTSESYVQTTIDVLVRWRVNPYSDHVRRGLDPKAIVKAIQRSVMRPRYAIAPKTISARRFSIEPDASSAVYWWLAATTAPDSRVIVPGMGRASIQPDHLALGVFGRIGAKVTGERRISVRGSESRHALREINAQSIPDASLALAVCAATVNLDSSIEGLPQEITTRITGLRTLRVKETDRIAALANELRKVGCTVETGEDWIAITPAMNKDSVPIRAATVREQQGPLADARGSAGTSPSPIEPIVIETYNDHRMAMSFAILGLNPPNGVPLSIRNPKCVAKSYPTFWKDFAKLYGD